MLSAPTGVSKRILRTVTPVNDFVLYVVTPIVVTLCAAYLVIGLATYLRGRRPAVPQRLLALFDLGRDLRPHFGIGAVVIAGILAATEFAAGQSLVEGVRDGRVVESAMWLLHFGVLLSWSAYLWRSG